MSNITQFQECIEKYYSKILIMANELANRIKELRHKQGLTQDELAQKLGVSRKTIVNYETGGVIPASKREMLKALLSELSGNAIPVDEPSTYIDLPYIPVKARAGFIELGQIPPHPIEFFRVIFTDDTNLKGQVVIEIDGDSMEPNYTAGTKVRCKPVDPGDWIYINSGVYAIVYSNFFVVKRVKNSPVDGVLTLHSDNTETGGVSKVRLEDIRNIWKVVRIVDAPAR